MQNNHNEFYPTINQLRSGLLDQGLFSQNIFEDEKQRPGNTYKCSLVDIPEFIEQNQVFSFIKANDEPLNDFFKKNRNSYLNMSNNSLFNFDNIYRTPNQVSRPAPPEDLESVQENDQVLNLKSLCFSRKNIFESEFLKEPEELPLKPVKKNLPQEKPEEEKKKPKVACHCKKSKCLRLYCECFAKGIVCGVDCACEGCFNKEEHQELRELVIKETLEKNPFAFKSKYKKLQTDEKILHSRGCNCSKTGCIKKYCECFNAGTGCSRLCKCSNCKNKIIELEDSEVKIYYDRVLRKRSKKSILNQPLENNENLFQRVKHE